MKILKSIDRQQVFFKPLIINAFLLLFFCTTAHTLSAQCRYLSKKNPTQTRLLTLINGVTIEETLAVKVRTSDDQRYLDIHFKTTEAAFSIRKGSVLTLMSVNGQSVELKATDMLYSDAYNTCCDVVWLAEVAYFIPKEKHELLINNNISEIRLELDNRQRIFYLKKKKQRKIGELLRCF